jgi:hypothetical protein
MRLSSTLAAAAAGLVAVAIATAACVSASSTTSDGTPAPSMSSAASPADGRAVLAMMHDRYEKTWYRTLTFVQKTVQKRPDGTEQVTTWYEAQSGPRLRIDMGDPKLGNGALYTADSLYVVRAGKVVRSQAEGNPFLPLVVGVYIQPLETTVAQLAEWKVDLTKLREESWEGRPHWVIGATSAADTAAPQVWVDRERLVVTRFTMPLFPSPDGRSQDVRLEGYVPLAGGWISPVIRILDKGVAVQTEQYSDWKANVELPAHLFQAERWNEQPHWMTAAATPAGS